ncbi:MAG: hypothetical protein ABR505_01565 [Actinomycetota bacterium]
MAITDQGAPSATMFWALVVGFVGQIGGRLVDLQWHLTHEEFEGAAEQLQAHWLIWLSTAFVLGVAALALRQDSRPAEQRGYLLVLLANLAYAIVAVIHFLQHLDHREVDWAHLLLALTSIAAAIGVIWVIARRFTSRRNQPEAVA